MTIYINYIQGVLRGDNDLGASSSLMRLCRYRELADSLYVI